MLSLLLCPCPVQYSGVFLKLRLYHPPRRLVNKTLASELETIHAFSQKTLTPEEYEKQQAA